MRKSTVLKEINKTLEESGNLVFIKPDKLQNIINSEEVILKEENKLIYKLVCMTGYDSSNKFCYQNCIKINDCEIYLDDISKKKSFVFIFNDMLFLVNDNVLAIPFDFMFISMLNNDPYNKLSNLIHRIKAKEDINCLKFDETETRIINANIQKRQNKINNIGRLNYIIGKVNTLLVSSLLISLLADMRCSDLLGKLTLLNTMIFLINQVFIYRCFQRGIIYVTEANLNYIESCNRFKYISSKVFKTPSSFSFIRNVEDKTLLENSDLKLHFTKTSGYVDEELVNQFALFLNEIELWHSEYVKDDMHFVVFNNCVYILKDECICIGFDDILKSIYSDNPVDTLNEKLEGDKIKKLKR